MNAKVIIAIVFFMLFVGSIATMMGYGHTGTLPGEPVVTSSSSYPLVDWWRAYGPLAWLSWLHDVLPDPLQFAWDSMGTFLLLVTFQLTGVPDAINVLVLIPFCLGMVWLIGGMIRGSQGG